MRGPSPTWSPWGPTPLFLQHLQAFAARSSPRRPPKVHTPAYASLNGGSDDMVLDLSEILDISESGVAIQTSSSWEISRVLNLCLDLSETKTYLHTTGYVVWADRAGRIGVRFPSYPKPPDENCRSGCS